MVIPRGLHLRAVACAVQVRIQGDRAGRVVIARLRVSRGAAARFAEGRSPPVGIVPEGSGDAVVGIRLRIDQTGRLVTRRVGEVPPLLPMPKASSFSSRVTSRDVGQPRFSLGNNRANRRRNRNLSTDIDLERSSEIRQKLQERMT